MLIADRFYFAAHSHEGPESPLELAFMDKFSGYCLKLKDKIPPTHKLYDLIADYLKLSNSRDYNIAPLTDHALDIYDNTLVIKRLADGIEFEVAAFELEETDEKFVAQFVGDLSLRIDKLTTALETSEKQRVAALKLQNEALCQMDNMIKEKDQMEQELFEKFALLMEEKKVKIRELTAQSSVKTNETAHEDPPVEPPAKRGRRKKTTG